MMRAARTDANTMRPNRPVITITANPGARGPQCELVSSITSLRVRVRYTTVARIAEDRAGDGGTQTEAVIGRREPQPAAEVRTQRAGQNVGEPEGQHSVRASRQPITIETIRPAGKSTDVPGPQPLSSSIQSPAAVPRAKVTRTASQ